MSMAASASCTRLGHHHAFAGGEAVGLHDDRRTFLAHIIFGRARALEAFVGRGRDVVGLAQILGEALGAFQPRRPFGRAERLDAGSLQIVDNAGAERRLRARPRRGRSCLSLAERDHRRLVGQIERDAFGLLRDAGIARRAIEPVGQRARRHLPGQRVLASAGTEDEDVHARAARPLGERSPIWCSMAPCTSQEIRPVWQSRALNNVVEWTVSELSAALKRTVEDAYGYVRVRGEISGFEGRIASGHCYFRLKDDKAVLEAVIWKGVFGRMRVKPEEGLDVIVSGKLTTFAGSSKYQIVIETLEPAGIGALMKLLEERKKKLAAEGLFDEARKQLLPFLPRRDRRRDLADRRRDPRHPASAGRPLSAPRAGLAGAGAGRDARPQKSPPPSTASTRCPKAARCRGPT